MTTILCRFLAGCLATLLLGLGADPARPPAEKHCQRQMSSPEIPPSVRAMIPPSMSLPRIVVVDGSEPLRFFTLPSGRGTRLPAMCGADVNM